MSSQPVSVVFVHGVRTSSHIWAAQEAVLAAAGHDYRSVDLPGHGERITDPFTLESAFEVIDSAVDSLGKDARVMVVGLSLGGYVTLAYAARRPAAVVGVIAAACSSETYGKPLLAYRDLAHTFTLGTEAARKIQRSIATRMLHQALRRPDVTAAVPTDAQLDGTPPRPGWGIVTQMLTALAGTSSIGHLKRIEVPVWLVNGSKDHLRWEERRYLRARPESQLRVVKGAGHDVNTDAPDAFNTILLQALAAISTPPTTAAPSFYSPAVPVLP